MVIKFIYFTLRTDPVQEETLSNAMDIPDYTNARLYPKGSGAYAVYAIIGFCSGEQFI